jgi:hypothetical protein
VIEGDYTISEDTTLNENLTVKGDLRVEKSLNLNGYELNVTKDMTITGYGRLYMPNDAKAPYPVDEAGSFEYGGKIYLLGGYGDGHRYDHIRIFDKATKSWSISSTKLSKAKQAFTGEFYDGKYYIFGGYDGNSLDTIEVYDPSLDSITTLSTKLPKKLYALSSVIVGDKIYLFGGYDSYNSEYSSDIYLYDISKDTDFSGFAKWEISSYVATDKEEILTFEELAQKSCNEKEGIKALMSLKADVDNMGLFIQNSDVTNSFAKYNFFSRMIDYYFSVYVPNLLKGTNTYTIFAGGDDLFILGAWDEMINLSKKIREDFLKFVKGSSLTLSVGMILTKPNKPVNFIAQMSEEALEKSKDIDEKDAFTLFDETVKWDDYLDDNGLLEELEILNDNTTMLYRLLKLVELSKKAKTNPKATIWKSKLNYLFSRNMDINKKEVQDLLKNLNLMIEKFPKETKMYLRRKKPSFDCLAVSCFYLGKNNFVVYQIFS